MIKSLKQDDCKLVLRHNYIGHLAYIYQNKPFVIPISYFYKDDKIICYSGEGHKINALRKHNAVALEVSEINTSDYWKSVVAHGIYKELKGSSAKALLHEFSFGVKDIIMRRELRDLDFISEFSARINSNDIPIVFIIDIEEITGKMRRN